MKKSFSLLLAVLLSLFIISCKQKRSGTPKVLVFSKTGGFRHSSIPVGKQAIIKLGDQNNF